MKSFRVEKGASEKKKFMRTHWTVDIRYPAFRFARYPAGCISALVDSIPIVCSGVPGLCEDGPLQERPDSHGGDTRHDGPGYPTGVSKNKYFLPVLRSQSWSRHFLPGSRADPVCS